jgi:ribose 5-phosphate isomerase A
MAKRAAAEAALGWVEDGMVVGLGTGSTARFFVEGLADLLADGLLVRGVPTSEATEALARAHGIPLLPVEQIERIHLTVDGADEVDPQGRMIKGGGAALLREKIIATASDHVICIADASKKVDTLGAFPLPVEVVPFGWTLTARRVHEALRACGVVRPHVTLRLQAGSPEPVMTDGAHVILDCDCGMIPDPEALALALNAIPGVVEHGLFLNIARTFIFGHAQGAEIIEL